ncbi:MULTISPECIES: hypothetical protein [Bacillus]|nr:MULTISPECIES: hypothetical protein [Bacillus]MDI6566666.1 hypothetical protein [Bacillus subtilis]MDL2028988.1 hypothetical protein [Bacillus subtilis]MDP0485142.1 hypothetical protein [Bacillus subtilis]MEC1583327.1 hypothetical protein [Bacillus subtilis]MED4559864.1 hypothetical protein [Bacillus subtilis]
MKLEPIEITPPNDAKTTEEQMKEQILDLQRMCNVLMVNQP